MSDQSDPSTPIRPRRKPRFVLPKDHHDEQATTTAGIEAFLGGPVAAGRRPREASAPRLREASAPRPREAPTPRQTHPIQMDTRPDWKIAVRREDARQARYGRPTSVLLIEVAGRPDESALDGIARDVVGVIRAEARETDRAVRMGPTSFRLLLLETGDPAARTLAERLQRGFRVTQEHRSHHAELSIEIATVSRAGSLADAMVDAERRMIARADER